jgi:hypothetical protein
MEKSHRFGIDSDIVGFTQAEQLTTGVYILWEAGIFSSKGYL